MRYETLYSFHDILTLYSPQERYKIKAKFLYPLACYCVFFGTILMSLMLCMWNI